MKKKKSDLVPMPNKGSNKSISAKLQILSFSIIRPKTAVRLAETENNGPKITPLESALRKIKFWIRAKSLLSEDVIHCHSVFT